MKLYSVLIIPITVILLASVLYFSFIGVFSGFGASNSRFINVLNFYDTVSEESTLFLGDSQVREDIDCNLLDCFNLGISGILPLQIAIQNELIIISNPKIVYLGVSPLHFNEELNVNNDLYVFLGDKLALPSPYLYQLLSDSEKDLITMGKLNSGLYKGKFVLPYYLNLISSMFYKSDIRLSTSNFKNPWQFSEQQSEAVLLKKISNETLMRSFDFSDSNSRQKNAFEYLVKFLSGKGIKVIIVKMPLNPLMKKTIDTSNFDSYISSLNLKYDILVADYLWSYDKTNFVDLTHLNSEGRKLLSENLRGESYIIQ